MHAPAVYIVRFWVKPGAEKLVFDWLDDSHIDDVIRQPGFLWSRRFSLDGTNDEGWPAHAMIYGLESTAALQAYFASEAPKRYARERAALGIDAVLKAERQFGACEKAFDK